MKRLNNQNMHALSQTIQSKKKASLHRLYLRTKNNQTQL